MPKAKTKEKKEVKEKEVAKPKKISQADFEKKVITLAKEGITSEKIGEALRKEGAHSNDYKKTISQILKENELYVDPELKNVEAKLERIEKHFEKNKQDKRAKREKDRIFSQLRKIKKYLGITIVKKKKKK
jgi:ribosomal protein S15P/S13E